MQERVFRYDILPQIQERWSPRAFSEEKIPKDDILALIEAASYAPSCYNEQPWCFLIADDEEKLAKLRGVLTPQNQVWANRAPVLLLIAAKKTFTLNGKENFWHMFDTGTSWGFLSLEAVHRGLVTHAMGGFDPERARETFAIPEDFEIVTVVAVGKYGNPADLPDDLQKRERPDVRRDIESLLLR